VLLDDPLEPLAFVCEARITDDELVIPLVDDVIIHRNDVDRLKPDVYSDPGRATAKPEEVRHLFGVRDVIGRLKLRRRRQILAEDVVRQFDALRWL